MNTRLPAKVVQRNEGVPYARRGSRETGHGETQSFFRGSNELSKSQRRNRLYWARYKLITIY